MRLPKSTGHVHFETSVLRWWHTDANVYKYINKYKHFRNSRMDVLCMHLHVSNSSSYSRCMTIWYDHTLVAYCSIVALGIDEIGVFLWSGVPEVSSHLTRSIVREPLDPFYMSARDNSCLPCSALSSYLLSLLRASRFPPPIFEKTLPRSEWQFLHPCPPWLALQGSQFEP